MHISNARYLFSLRRLQKVAATASPVSPVKSAFIALLLLMSPFILRGQTAGRGNYNYLDFQGRPYYFGITLGYNESNYRVFRGQNFILNDSVAGVESLGGPGFNLQIVSNLKLGENFDLRFLPGFSFAERNLVYDAARKNKPDYPNNVSSVFVELPFHVRYKSAPYNDKRLFVIAGIKYSYDIQAKSRTRQIGNSVRISPTDFQAEFGVGMQMFFPFFIFSPEFKMSHGLGNILIYRSDLRESTVLEKLISRTFTISLHFEG
jgi:hypothetical protein